MFLMTTAPHVLVTRYEKHLKLPRVIVIADDFKQVALFRIFELNQATNELY